MFNKCKWIKKAKEKLKESKLWLILCKKTIQIMKKMKKMEYSI